jgi:hypothetical protein
MEAVWVLVPELVSAFTLKARRLTSVVPSLSGTLDEQLELPSLSDALPEHVAVDELRMIWACTVGAQKQKTTTIQSDDLCTTLSSTLFSPLRPAPGVTVEQDIRSSPSPFQRARARLRF